MAKEIVSTNTLVLAALLIVIIASILFLEGTKPRAVAPNVTITSGGPDISNLRVGSNVGNLAPEIIEGGEWFNTEPLTMAQLRGKVVVIDFWTYTCINCIRTFPFLKSWHKKYADKGLVIIGVHTPEFNFEREAENVRMAIEDNEIGWPVIQDNDYATWRVYDNRYWPHKFLIDKDGIIRYHHIGEGAYEETEQKIVELLEERGITIAEIGELPEVEQENLQSVTHELYIGLQRGSFGNVQASSVGTYEFTDPETYSPHIAYFSGNWSIQSEYSRFAGVENETGELILRYYAKNVNVVLKPQNGEGSFRILQDGSPLGPSNNGADVNLIDGASSISVTIPKLYSVVRNEDYGFHELRFVTNSSNFEIYAFTFG